MSFGLPSQSANAGKPYLKYDGRAGRLFRVDRSQSPDGTWTSNDVDISNGATFVADFANVRVGYINYPKGAAPQKVMVPYGSPMPPRPSDVGADGKPLFRDGFEFDVVLHASCAGSDNGQAREVSSTAKVAIEGFGAAFGKYLEAPERGSGKLPVLKMVSTTAIKSGQSTNYQPIFEIVGWVDRPNGLKVGAAPAPVAAPAATAFTPPAAPVTLPSAPQPAASMSMDFG